MLPNFHNKYTHLLNELNKQNLSIEQSFENRKIWFDPWERLLSLIQVTEDNMPIELSKISEIVDCREDHAENLVIWLLEENSYIGGYDKTAKIYTKGVKIQDYIDIMLGSFKKDLGKLRWAIILNGCNFLVQYVTLNI